MLNWTVLLVDTILQSHAKDTSLRGGLRVRHRAYGTAVSSLRSTSQKEQLVHNQAKRLEGMNSTAEPEHSKFS